MKIKKENGASVIGMLLFIAIIVVVCLLVGRTLNLFGGNETENSAQENNMVQEDNVEAQ